MLLYAQFVAITSTSTARRALISFAALVGCLSVGVPVASAASVGSVTEYPTKTPGGAPGNLGPQGITGRSDGTIWFVEAASLIGRITTAGSVTEYPTTAFGAGPWGIVGGPSGELWFTQADASSIGTITAKGVAGSSVSTLTANAAPYGIAARPAGGFVFTEHDAGNVGFLDTATNTVTENAVPSGAGAQPDGVTWGPDDAMWFAEYGANRIGRFKFGGSVEEFSAGITAGAGPMGIAVGPDGNLWFTEHLGNRIGRITPSGTVTEFSLPNAAAGPTGIVAGPDGNLWFTESDASRIGRITTSGSITSWPTRTSFAGPSGITVGSDGGIWFAEPNSDRIGRLSPLAGGPNTVAPKVTGKGAVGQTLRASRGTWSQTPTSATYQWLRDGKAVTVARPARRAQSAASAATYKVTAKDVGHRVSCRVTVRMKAVSVSFKATSNAVSVPKASKPSGRFTG